MGVIRVLLAVSVVLQHIWRGDGNPSTPSGPLAVQAFFMISGFYMSLILTSDVYAGNPLKFWTSRVLRLFPSYWIVAGVSLLTTVMVAPEIFAALWKQGAAALALVTFANIFIIGQDVLLWLVNVGGALQFVADPWSHPQPRFSNFMLIGPAWTLALELTFYAMAPFLVKLQTRTLILMAMASVAGRFVAYAAGLDHEPWTYRFFPFELAFFLFGMIAQRMAPGEHGRLLLGLLIVLICGFHYLPQIPFWVQTVNDWALLALVFLALPSVFAATKDSRLDAALGELSYPVYLTHMVVAAGLSGFGFGHPFWIIIALTFVFSAMLAFGVDRPLSSFRHRIEFGAKRAALAVSRR